MKALLMVVLVVVVIGGGLKLAGVPVPFIDYAVGPIGEGRGPSIRGVNIDAPGFGEFEAP